MTIAPKKKKELLSLGFCTFGTTVPFHTTPEEVGHNFHEKLIACTLFNVHTVLTQQVDVGCGGVYGQLW